MPLFIRMRAPILALDIEHVRADERNALHERAVQSFNRSPHECNRDDADDDPERSEDGAHFVGANGAPRNAHAFFELGQEVHDGPRVEGRGSRMNSTVPAL